MPKINPHTLRVKGWDKWQSYRKDRGQPPWIKLHQSLRRDPDWVDLTDAQKGQLVSLWLLAADRNGVIPYDSIKIQKLLYLDHKFDLEFFVLQGFLIKGNSRRQRDANVTPTRRQHDALEAETETETEAETEAEGADALDLPPGLSADKWCEWEQHRIEIKKRLTASAVAKQLAFLNKQPDPSAVIDNSIMNGWTGLFEVKQNGNQNGRGNSSNGRLSAAERVERAIAERDANAGTDGFVVDADGWVVR